MLPLIGAALVLAVPAWHTSGLRRIALGSSCATLVMTLLLWICFDFSVLRPQFAVLITTEPWLDLTLGIDGLSLLFIILTAFTLPVCLLLGWGTSHRKEYCLAFLILEFFMLAVFSCFMYQIRKIENLLRDILIAHVCLLVPSKDVSHNRVLSIFEKDYSLYANDNY